MSLIIRYTVYVKEKNVFEFFKCLLNILWDMLGNTNSLWGTFVLLNCFVCCFLCVYSENVLDYVSVLWCGVWGEERRQNLGRWSNSSSEGQRQEPVMWVSLCGCGRVAGLCVTSLFSPWTCNTYTTVLQCEWVPKNSARPNLPQWVPHLLAYDVIMISLRHECRF